MLCLALAYLFSFKGNSTCGIDEWNLLLVGWLSIFAGTAPLLHILLKQTIDEFNSLNNVKYGNLISKLRIRANASRRIDLFRHDSSLILNEIEGILHEFDRGTSMNTNC